MNRTVVVWAIVMSAAACDGPAGPSPEDRFRTLGYWSGACEEDVFTLRCGIIDHVGNSYVRGLNDGESGPINLDSAVVNQKYVRWGFYIRPQRAQSKLCYFHPLVNDWLCNWVWATYTATGILADSADAGSYTADQGDWAALFTFFEAGRHRVILHAESDGYPPIADTIEVHIESDSAPPPPPPKTHARLAQVVRNGRVVSELRMVQLPAPR